MFHVQIHIQKFSNNSEARHVQEGNTSLLIVKGNKIRRFGITHVSFCVRNFIFGPFLACKFINLAVISPFVFRKKLHSIRQTIPMHCRARRR